MKLGKIAATQWVGDEWHHVQHHSACIYAAIAENNYVKLENLTSDFTAILYFMVQVVLEVQKENTTIIQK